MADDQRFRLLGFEEARRILKSVAPTAEMSNLRLRAVRRLLPVTTEAERELSKRYALEHPRAQESRLEKLRKLANARPHRCAGYGCATMIPPHELMCFEHWVLIPDWLQERLKETEDKQATTMRWPIELVEQAIKFTMTEGDFSAVLSRIETSHQDDLFATEKAS